MSSSTSRRRDSARTSRAARSAPSSASSGTTVRWSTRATIEGLPGVSEVLRVLKPFKLASIDFQPTPTVVTIGQGPATLRLGAGEKVVVMAGPCAVESREQLLEVAQAVRAAGARMLRGGAFKPRSSPYSFQGLGEEGLRYLARVAS